MNIDKTFYQSLKNDYGPKIIFCILCLTRINYSTIKSRKYISLEKKHSIYIFHILSCQLAVPFIIVLPIDITGH